MYLLHICFAWIKLQAGVNVLYAILFYSPLQSALNVRYINRIFRPCTERLGTNDNFWPTRPRPFFKRFLLLLSSIFHKIATRLTKPNPSKYFNSWSSIFGFLCQFTRDVITRLRKRMQCFLVLEFRHCIPEAVDPWLYDPQFTNI